MQYQISTYYQIRYVNILRPVSSVAFLFTSFILPYWYELIWTDYHLSPFGPSILRDYALPILDVCSVVIGHVVYIRTGTCDVINTSTEYMEMPVKAFEMVHLHTYQSDFISTYSKAACQVDTQLALAQHAQREVRNRGHHNVAVASCLSLDFDCGILDNHGWNL